MENGKVLCKGNNLNSVLGYGKGKITKMVRHPFLSGKF